MKDRLDRPTIFFTNDDVKAVIYTCLRDWILYTTLMPGQKLNERDLAQQFGVSRTPLREVLQLLAIQGLLNIRPRQGIFVAPIETNFVREVFEVRLPLEKAVARLAAERATTKDIKELRVLSDLSEEALKSGSYAEGIRLDAAFHDALSKASNNLVLRQTRESLHNVCLRYWYLILDRYQPDEIDLSAHLRLVEAVEERDSEKAAEIHGLHVSHFLQLLE
ncbi:GntR family transcriptional regulator [uncultured Pseudodesulfovibrio sp.]|uniref:GntR family transcriptional regulator n=1 Tax=uncultured Pseudodesulfovibrio sp. TaxID=2035858 RepID=UPI0029C74D0B|nr:GntR family transcriptional regulator [uncultured Pseudodesulfovibrio sp.]